MRDLDSLVYSTENESFVLVDRMKDTAVRTGTVRRERLLIFSFNLKFRPLVRFSVFPTQDMLPCIDGTACIWDLN